MLFRSTLKTSIDTTLSSSLGTMGKEVPHSRKNVESRVKRNIKRKLLNRSKRPSTDGWRLNHKEFDELHSIYKFTVEGWRDSLGLNVHKVLPFYSEQNSFLDHDVSGHQPVYCNPTLSIAIHSFVTLEVTVGN